MLLFYGALDAGGGLMYLNRGIHADASQSVNALARRVTVWNALKISKGPGDACAAIHDNLFMLEQSMVTDRNRV